VFSTLPDADRRTRLYLAGAILGQVVGLLVRYMLLTAPASFGLLSALLFLFPFPFLVVGAIGVTNPRSSVVALGYDLAILIAVEPLNQMRYDLAASLNEALAIAAGTGFGAVPHLWVLPERVWKLAR
jgi:uncharacterized membrane protein YccC